MCSSKPWFNNRLHYIVFDQTYVTGVAHHLSAIKNYRQKCEYFDQTKRKKFDFRQAKAYLQNPSKCYVWLMNLLELGRLPLSGKCQRPPGKSSKIPRTLGKLCPGCICIPCTWMDKILVKWKVFNYKKIRKYINAIYCGNAYLSILLALMYREIHQIQINMLCSYTCI